MHMKSKSIVALFLVVMTIATMFVPAMAINTTGQTPVSLTSEAAIFNVTIPTVLPVNADEQGNISVSNDIRITNSSWGPIYIAGLDVAAQNSWAIDGYDTCAMYAEKVDAKKIAMVINNCKTTSTGSIAYAVENFPRLEGRGGSNWITINYDAKLPAQNTTLSKVEPMNVMFTVAWLTASSPSTVPLNSNPESYNLALSSTPEALSVGEASSLTAIQDKGTIDWSSSNTSAVEVVPATSGSLFSFLPFVLTATAAENNVKSTVNLKAVGVGIATIAATNNAGDKVTREVSVVQTADGLKIESMPIKTSYKEGESFNPAGLVIKDISSGTQITRVNCDVVSVAHGQKTIDVWYMDGGTKKTITLPIIFKEKALVSIKATSAPSKTQYSTGEVFSPIGMVVTASYNDGSSAPVTGYTYPVTAFIGGETSVALAYGGKSCTTPVTVTTATAPVPANITDYYTFTDDTAATGGYKVGLNAAFKTALQANSGDGAAYKDWTPGTALPNPGSMYNGKAVTSMSLMFSDMTTVKTLNLIAWDTANVTTMSYMFQSCSGLTSLNISSFNTSKVTDAHYMFNYCSGLTSLDLSSFNTVNVTNMSNMFYRCAGLISLNLSSFDTANVTTMSNMFNYCSGLISLDLPSFNTANVTNMGSMFKGCTGLTSLDLSSFNTANVTNMDYMFFCCSGLTSLNVSSFNTANITNMGSMFYSCSGLTSLDLSSFNTTKVTNMDYMFFYCTGLTSLDLPSFNTANVTNVSYMFYYCTGLTSLNVSSFNTTKVTNMGSMFYSCSGLTSLDLSSFNTANVTAMYGMFQSCSKVTTAYAKTSADAIKLNASKNKPTTFTFMVKP